MKRSLVIFALLCVAPAAHAADGPPPAAIYLLERIEPGGAHELGQVDLGKGAYTPWYDALPLGGYDLAVHAATGRWVLSYGRLSNGDPLVIDGKPFETPEGVVALVLGQLGQGVVATLTGDKKCIAIKCFERAGRFSADGAVFVTELLRSSYTTLNRYVFAAGAAAQAFIPRSTKRRDATVFAITADDGRLATWAPATGLYVETLSTAWTVPSKKPVAPTPSKPVAKPALMLAGPILLADRHLVYFRREPVEQRQGYIEVFDLDKKQATIAYTFPQESPMWSAGLLYAAARRTVVFNDDYGGLFAFGLDDLAPRRIADARLLHDVSPDGRYVLFSRPAGGGDELCVYDLADGKIVATARHPSKAPRLVEAFFVTATP